uniref:Helicase n=1 Tax=Vibrio phage Vc1 TaxID=1480731 RepID=A0A6M5CAU0_9CAUD
MIPNIEKQLASLGDEKIAAIQKRFTVGEIVPYPYQCVAYTEIAKRLARYEHPFFVKAAVSAGKTIIFAMVAAQCRKMGLKMLTLARQSEIVDQDSKEISSFGVPNSVYCAGLGLRGAHFPIVVGSEGTVINGLEKALGDYVPDVLGIDECHQVNWNDIVEARENNETLEQMKTPKGDLVPNFIYKGFICNQRVIYVICVTIADYLHAITKVTCNLVTRINLQKLRKLPGLITTPLKGTGRTQYTVIIETMRKRCLETNGRELRIFGMTGSEYRGVEPILIEDMRIHGFGANRPTVFGDVGDLGYDLSEFHSEHELGVADYSEAQLKAMSKKIHESGTMTQQIMNMVHEVMKTVLCALVTCADARHCKEAAAALPHGTPYHIITGKTGEKQRREWLNDAYEGKVKYIFRVKALTTGVNIPPWDTSVILRKIGSLTLLVQLLGRGMRQLKSYHKNELGMTKRIILFLIFLEQCSKWVSYISIPFLNRRNISYARTVKRSVILPDLQNQKTAYRHDEYYDVVEFKVELTSNGNGILFRYDLRGINGESFVAYEKFWVQSDSKWIRNSWKSTCFKHILDKRIAGATASYKDARKVMMNAHHFLAPKRVSWRKNTKGEDMIGNKEY